MLTISSSVLANIVTCKPMFKISYENREVPFAEANIQARGKGPAFCCYQATPKEGYSCYALPGNKYSAAGGKWKKYFSLEGFEACEVKDGNTYKICKLDDNK